MPKTIIMEFKTGNVFKLGSILGIITEVRNETTRWVSFNCENSSGVTQNITTNNIKFCHNCEDITPECEYCKGKGNYYEERIGMDKAVFLASNVKDYITDRLLKNFDFE